MLVGKCAWDEKQPTRDLTPDADAAWTIFCLGQSQWNVGMSGATGMRYEGIEALARMAGIEVSKRAFQLFQLLEGRRLKIWGDEAAAAKAEAERKNKK